MIKLSKRLEMIMRLCGKSKALADIGCDHAYLPIYALENDLAEKAYAMDLREGPLKIARENIIESGLQEKIEIRLSDGTDKLQPGEADCISVSGMGGVLICRILEVGAEVFKAADKIVLQPQSDIELVRKKLFELGFKIEEEDCVFDEGKFYMAFRAVKGEDEAYANASEAELRFGKQLLSAKNPYLKIYLFERLAKCDSIVAEMRLNGRKLFDEPVMLEKKMIEEALSFYN